MGNEKEVICFSCKHCDLHDYEPYGLYYCMLDNRILGSIPPPFPPDECKHFVKKDKL